MSSIADSNKMKYALIAAAGVIAVASLSWLVFGNKSDKPSTKVSVKKNRKSGESPKHRKPVVEEEEEEEEEAPKPKNKKKTQKKKKADKPALNVSGETKEYENEKLGLKFSYPANWEKQESIQHPVFVIKFVDPAIGEDEEGEMNTNGPNILIIVEELAEPLDAHEYMEKSKETIRNVPGMSVDFLTEKKAKLGDQKAYELEYIQKFYNPSTENYVEIKAWNFLTVIGRRAYCVQYISTLENFDNTNASTISKSLEISQGKPSLTDVFYRSKQGLEIKFPNPDFRVERENENDLIVEMAEHTPSKDKKNIINAYTFVDSTVEEIKATQLKKNGTSLSEESVKIGELDALRLNFKKKDLSIVVLCVVKDKVGYAITFQFDENLAEATAKSINSVSFPSEKKQNGLTYVNPEYAFQVEIPSTMQIVENSLGDPVVSFLYGNIEQEEIDEEDPMTETSVSVKELEQKIPFELVQKIIFEELNSLKQAGHEIKIESQKTKTISGLKSFELLYTQSSYFGQTANPLSLKFLLNCMLKEDKLYMIKSYTLEPFFDAPSKKFEKIAQSFKLL